MRRVGWALLVLWFCGAPAALAGPTTFEELAKSLSPRSWSKLASRQREARIEELGALSDPRAVPLILKLQRRQAAMAKARRATWLGREEAWAERTEKLERPIEKRRRKFYRDGSKYTIAGEAEAWLGSSNVTGAMHAEKKRIERVYRDVLTEERLVTLLTGAAVEVAARLEAEPCAKAVKQLLKAVDGLSLVHRGPSIEQVGALSAPEVERWLLEGLESKERTVQASASLALGMRGSASGVAALVARLQAPHWQQRADAIAGLGRAKRPEGVDALLQHAVVERGVLVAHVRRALETLFGAKHAKSIPAWTAWWSKHREAFTRAWAEGRTPDLKKAKAAEGTPKIGSTSFYGISTPSRHVIFVIDMSSSMKKRGTGLSPRYVVARRQLAEAIAGLSKERGDDAGVASFNIVAYGTFVDVYRKSGMVAASKTAKEKALAWFEKECIPVGMTNSFDALATALELAREANAKGKAADTIYFMTDAGAPNRGRFHDVSLLLRAVADRSRGQHVTIHTVGVGTKIDKTMLRELAKQSGGETSAR